MTAPHACGLAGVALVSLIGVGIKLLLPWPFKWAIDHVLRTDGNPVLPHWLKSVPGASSPSGVLAWLAGASVILFVARRANEAIEHLLKQTVGLQMSLKCGELLFDDLQHRSPATLSQYSVGDLMSRIKNDTGCVRYLVFGVYVPLLTALASLVGIVVIVWPLDRLLTLIALAMTLPMAATIHLCASHMTQRTYEQAEHEGKLMTAAERAISAVPVVQAFAQEDRETRNFEQQASANIRSSLRLLMSQLVFKAGVSGVATFGTAIVMAIGGFRALHGEISVGDLYLFLIYVGSLYGPVEALAHLAGGIATARARASRVFEVLDTPEQVTESDDPRPLPQTGQAGCAVEFRNVRYGYEAGRPVIRDISFKIRPGETIALVGPSGVGKSTLVGMLPRFADPWEGCVLIDGVDARHVQLRDLRRRIAWVPQDPMLFPLTVAQNIAYGMPDTDRDKIVRAAQIACADEFIRTLPEGYDTMLGERAANLSGGQAQRLAIARAVVRDAPILVLDEPTSALDTETETAVMRAITQASRSRTTIVIAHRLSTVRRADRIIVVRDGAICEQGTHDELLSAQGEYHRLVHAGDVLRQDPTTEQTIDADGNA